MIPAQRRSYSVPLCDKMGHSLPLAVLSVGVAACASPPAQLTRSDRSGGYRPGPGGKLYRVYPPQSVEARIILIAARVDLRPLIEQSERGGMAPAAGSIVNLNFSMRGTAEAWSRLQPLG